jgi:hypothetical protein
MNETFLALGTISLLIAITAFIFLIATRRPKPPARFTTPPPQPPHSRTPALPHAPPPTHARSPYERIPTLLTAAERDFFAVLREAAPAGHHIFAQVRLAGLVQVKQAARRDKSHWWRIQAKCLDFVLLDSASFAPRLVVELDDRSHDRADRRERDAFVDEILAAVGLPILHVRWQRRYDQAALAEQLALKLGIAQPAAPSRPATGPLRQQPAQPPAADHFWRPIATPAAARPEEAGSPAAPRPEGHQRACGQCQAPLSDNAKFCAHCGAVFAIV